MNPSNPGPEPVQFEFLPARVVRTCYAITSHVAHTVSIVGAGRLGPRPAAHFAGSAGASDL